MAAFCTKVCEATAARRSGDYKPCVWGADYLLSLKNNYSSEEHTRRVEKLRGDVRTMLVCNMQLERALSQLELIDDLQRLGLAYHFKKEINNVMYNIYHDNNNNNDQLWTKGDLHATALAFRLFRQDGYHLPQEVFGKFKDETGSFKTGLCDDIKGMLSLYEASYLSTEGESMMEEAWEFTFKHLKELTTKVEPPSLAMLVNQALVFPLHWRMSRLEARWFIDVYKIRSDMNSSLLELAKLDFNIVQGMYQEELRDMSRWYINTGLREKMSFTRDSIVASYLWTVGVAFEPQYHYCRCRRTLTKAFQFITILDDIYDIYGTLDEVELFTNALERWEISAMAELPDYMKICFLALFNSVNEIAYEILIEQGFDALASLKKTYVDLCKAYLMEARWYHTGYKPTLEEYLNVASISIAYPAIVSQAYLFIQKPIPEKELKCLESIPDLMRWCGIVSRITDDLATASAEMKRGDTPKAIQCYMYETGVSEEAARDHMKKLIREGWKMVNTYRVAAKSPLSQTPIDINMNLLRMAQCVYQYGDGHGVQDGETKDRMLCLLFEPIPL